VKLNVLPKGAYRSDSLRSEFYDLISWSIVLPAVLGGIGSSNDLIEIDALEALFILSVRASMSRLLTALRLRSWIPEVMTVRGLISEVESLN